MLLLLVGIIFAFLSFLVMEIFLIRKMINAFKHRIIINGTRGKSTVVQYIHAGLSSQYDSETNKKTGYCLGKITGVIPALLLPNGESKKINRRGGARVQEQFRAIFYASKLKVDNIVFECMSINPELQKLESKILQPTVYVITNIKKDHYEQMGKDLTEQVKSICEAIPYNSIVVTGAVEHIDVINQTAKLRNTKVIVPEFASSSLQYKERNIELALEVCIQASVTKEVAYERIIKRSKSISTRIFVLPNNSKFIDGFAVNDVPSAELFIEHWRGEFPELNKLVIVLNSRNDRPLRTLVFAKWFASADRINTTNLILIGNHVPFLHYKLLKSGFDKNKIVVWKKRDIKNVYLLFEKLNLSHSLVVGLGNIADEGFRFINALERGNDFRV